MSLTITVRPQGATSGGDTHALPTEGDNGNQEIDTRAEAEAALTHLPESSTNVVVIGDRTYTRAQLIEIRDRNAAPAASNGNDGTVMGSGASHGFFLEGQYAGGLGNRAHNGGGVRVGYRAGIPLANGNTQLTLDPVLGLDIGGYSAGFRTPGGEAVQSGFTRYGGLLGADLRVAPNFWDHRMSFSGGLRFGVGGFGTADSATVNLPQTCTPDNFGRGECEPNAGPRTGNAGTRGLMNFDSGSARGTSGVYLYAGIPLTVGIDIARGDWGNLRGVLGFEPGYTQLMPSDGHGFGFWSMAGTLGISGNFGGSAVQRPRRSEAPAETRTDRASEQTRTAGEALTLADDAAVRAFGGLGADARILGVQFDNLPEDTSAPYEVPASAMTAGRHEIKIRYRNPGDTTDRIRVVPLNIGEPVRVPEGNNGSSYGAMPNIPSNASRPAPDMVGGVATPRAIPIGSVQTAADLPAGTKYILYVDGNPVGSPQDLPADRNPILTLPASTTDGRHRVEFRMMRPNSPTTIYPAVDVTVGPAFPTLTAFDAVADSQPPPYRYRTAPFSITVNASSPGRVRITAGANTWERDVVAGPNTISLLANREARQHYSGAMTIQPLSGPGGSLVGTAVQSAHPVELGTAGRARVNRPTRPVARPLP